VAHQEYNWWLPASGPRWATPAATSSLSTPTVLCAQGTRVDPVTGTQLMCRPAWPILRPCLITPHVTKANTNQLEDCILHAWHQQLSSTQEHAVASRSSAEAPPAPTRTIQGTHHSITPGEHARNANGCTQHDAHMHVHIERTMTGAHMEPAQQ